MAEKTPPLSSEIGVAGVAVSGGMVVERVPALRALSGRQYHVKLREAAESDPGIATCLSVVELVCRSVKFDVTPSEARPEGDQQAQDEADFVKGVLFEDMSHSWPETVSDALTMGTHGYAYLETVFKRRLGPDQKDPAKRSRFTDGRVGLRKIVGRDQLTHARWELDESGGVQGWWQYTPFGTGGGRPTEVFIPIERALLMRTSRDQGNPEGRSLLRAVLQTYVEKRFLEQQEGVGAERDLTGVPVMRAPKKVIEGANATPPDPAAVAALAEALRTVRELKFNEQTGVVLSSEPIRDADGKPAGTYEWGLELIKSPGSKAVDTDKAIVRKGTEIYRRFALQFLMLGASGKGAFALAESATDFFVLTIQFLLDTIVETVNRHLLPRLWALNGIDPELMPTLTHDDIAPQDLAKLGSFIQSMASAGDPIGIDDEGANYFRRLIGAPERVPQDPRAGADMPNDTGGPNDTGAPNDTGGPEKTGQGRTA